MFVDQVEGALRTEFQGRKDEIRNRNLEELTTVKNAMEEMMDGLWQQLQSHISQYRDATADKRRTYNELLAKDKKGVAELESNNHKLIRLQGKPWRCEGSENKAGDGERLQAAIIGCVTKLGYRLSMDITLDIETNTRVFFLIKTTGDDTGNLVTVPNTSGKKPRTSSSLASFTQSCSQYSPL